MSIDVLRSRLDTLPAALVEGLKRPLPGMERLVAMRRFVVTGGGLSEGPARVLVALLRRAGRDARFVPQSRFVGWPEPREASTALVLFSQGLAPNARLPLPCRDRFGLFVLVTSVASHDLAGPDTLVWTVPPASEGGLLLRIVGPSVAVLVALRVGLALGLPVELSWLDEDGISARTRTALDLFGASRRPIALVVDEPLVDLAMPLRWKLLEGLRVFDPPVWDVLQVAHGPLQSLYEHEWTIVAVRSAPARHDDLFARLEKVLHPDRHRVVTLRATIEGPAAILELDAMLDGALCTTLEAHPIALDDWPARGLDGPLYDVDPDHGGTE